MKKTSAFFWFLSFCVLLFACQSQRKQPLAISSNTSKPLATITSTRTKIPQTITPSLTLTPIPILTPTVTLIPPYPTKQVLLDYYVSGNHSIFDLFYTDYDEWSELVLYEDGQLIIPSKTPQQKMLSTDEINRLFSQLESTGFYSIDNDHLYNFGNQDPPKVYDGLSYCVLAAGNKEHNLCAYEPYESFLVSEMRNTLKFLDNYYPAGMSPYIPNRILLWVELGRDSNVIDLPDETIPWKDSFPPLTKANKKIIYVEGDTAKDIFALFSNEVSFKVFSQDGVDYTVLINIVLPHEEITNLYEQ